MEYKLNKIFNLNLEKESVKKPLMTCIYFEILIQLSKVMSREKEKGLLVLGILELH